MKTITGIGIALLVALSIWFDVAVLHDGDWRCALNEKCVVVVQK